ncbi:right-handed parallel beta-helix repeat-containing protein [Methanobrevibacter curvatus]|uniref:right-handed parallel beta-helix repeat-containing protein n=1 Tax=Methanobrevibacter curvatus TaxID=49547 RepID=UPI0014720828|nr:right-handed parallel beta-helix repeat-containing protein [Methanobrevibacter curvatus]
MFSFVFLLSIAITGVDAVNIYVNSSNAINGDGSISDPFNNLGSAIDKINPNFGDNIIMGSGKYNTSRNNTNLSISRNLNIYGAKYYYNDKNIGDTILDGENSTRFFKISPGVTVNIYGITFINGNHKASSLVKLPHNPSLIYLSGNNLDPGSVGGAIYNEGTLNIANCTFKNNFVLSNGGAIYNFGNCNIINSNFINNTALRYSHRETIICGPTYDVYKGEGGAIANNNGNLTIKFSNFTSNSADNGATIYSINSSNLLIANSGFYYNSANKGVIFSCKSSKLNTVGSILVGKQKKDEKLIFNEGNATISNNNFSNGYYGIFSSGLAIVKNNTIKSCVFGIYVDSKKNDILGNTFFNCKKAISIHGINNKIYNNLINGPNKYGISVYGDSNLVQGNILNDNCIGIYVSAKKNNLNFNIIKNSKYAGVSIFSFGYNNLTSNNILGNGRYGIIMVSNNNIIKNSTITNIKYGVNLTGKHNSLKNNTIKSNHYGVVLSGNSNVLKRNSINSKNCININGNNNVLTLNKINATSYGIILRGSDNRVIGGNCADIIAKKGVYVKGNRNLLQNLEIKSKNYGINVKGSKNILIGNILAKNKKFGVQVSGNKNKLLKNTVTKNGDHGIKVMGNKNKISENKVLKNKYHQVKVLGIKNKFTKNKFKMKSKRAIHIVYSKNSFKKNN